MTGRSHLVFFVDDEEAVLSSIRRAIAEEPWQIRTFSTPEEALVAVPHLQPSVVVSDFYMPSMKGCDFLKSVSRLDPTITRMVLTGRPDLETVVASVQEGAVHRFLIKPWDNHQLCEAVRDAIRQRELQLERREVMSELRGAEEEHRRRVMRIEAEMRLAGRGHGDD